MPKTRITLSWLLCLFLFTVIPSSDAKPLQNQANKQQNAFPEIKLDSIQPARYKLTPQYSQAKRPSYPTKPIEKRTLLPKPKPIQQIKRGATLIGMSLVPPVLGTKLLCDLSGGCQGASPLDLVALSFLMGTSVGIPSAPFALSIGSTELTEGLSRLPELKKSDVQNMPVKPGQPTANLQIQQNGQTKNVQIQLEVKPNPIHLNQKIEISPITLKNRIPWVPPLPDKVHE